MADVLVGAQAARAGTASAFRLPRVPSRPAKGLTVGWLEASQHRQAFQERIPAVTPRGACRQRLPQVRQQALDVGGGVVAARLDDDLCERATLTVRRNQPSGTNQGTHQCPISVSPF